MSSDPLLNPGEETILRDDVSPFSSTHTQDLLLTVSFDNPPLDQRSSFIGCGADSVSIEGSASSSASSLNNNFLIFSSSNDVSAQQGTEHLLTASTPEVPVQDFIVRGSPGHTPFPRDKVIPSVPFNTPDVDNLEELLLQETEKQEAAFKDCLNKIAQLESQESTTSLLDDTPRRAFQQFSDISNTEKSMPRRILNRCMEESLDEIAGGCQSSPSASSTKTKEMMRRDRIKNSLEVLKRIVPGISDSDDQNEIFIQTTRYLLFLRKKVGAKFDRDFLSHFLP